MSYYDEYGALVLELDDVKRGLHKLFPLANDEQLTDMAEEFWESSEPEPIVVRDLTEEEKKRGELIGKIWEPVIQKQLSSPLAILQRLADEADDPPVGSVVKFKVNKDDTST